jgi:4-hydroxybenzoate polyprenyltransferase
MLVALLRSARAGNLPTIWSNTLVGVAIASSGGGPAPFVTAVAAMSLLYTGGMFLNDAADAGWDRQHKPSRPIVQGLISRRAVAVAAALCLSAGWGLCARAGVAPAIWASTLVAAIVAYNAFHKRTAWAVLLMAACRALVYPLAASIASGASPGGVWPASAAIAGATLLITAAARREDIRGARVSSALAWLVSAPYLIPILALGAGDPAWTAVAAGGLVAWSALAAHRARSGNIPAAVQAWIAGFSLGDTLLLALLGRPELMPIAVACWGLTVIAQRRIPGT